MGVFKFLQSEHTTECVPHKHVSPGIGEEWRDCDRRVLDDR